jgi:hypothetical protein
LMANSIFNGTPIARLALANAADPHLRKREQRIMKAPRGGCPAPGVGARMRQFASLQMLNLIVRGGLAK